MHHRHVHVYNSMSFNEYVQVTTKDRINRRNVYSGTADSILQKWQPWFTPEVQHLAQQELTDYRVNNELANFLQYLALNKVPTVCGYAQQLKYPNPAVMP